MDDRPRPSGLQALVPSVPSVLAAGLRRPETLAIRRPWKDSNPYSSEFAVATLAPLLRQLGGVEGSEIYFVGHSAGCPISLRCYVEAMKDPEKFLPEGSTFLKRSHRHKAALIGTPLRLQGADFYFFYTLHTIPCIGFRVDWRGPSMAFTGDHLNDPSVMSELSAKGVMTKARAEFLNSVPLQRTDLLLHEAGVPPIHTPLAVLEKLPERVKERLYVAYANRLIQEFKAGLLPLTDGTTLRTFLSKLLNCDPMRISKKFVGNNCIGKQVFRRKQMQMNALTMEE
ncbi:hypothetical protein TrCOL_g8154, partial [Triparma columacea]